MTLSERPRPNYSRRIFWLAIFTAVLFGGYTAAWFYAADQLETRSMAALSKLERDGVSARCVNPTARGYPFRIGLYCDDLAYNDAARNVAISAGNLRTAAQIYQPMLALGELDGPLRVSVPSIEGLLLDWSSLKASVRIARPLPQRVSIEATGLSGRIEPQSGDEQALFKVEQTEGHLWPNGADVDWAVSFTNLDIAPTAIEGRILPLMSGQVDASIKNGVELIAARPESLRGQSFDIRQLDLSSGNAGVSLAGLISIGEDGLIDATLTIGIRNPSALAPLLARALPEAENEISSGFSGLAVLRQEPTLPLRIVKGCASLGFIPLGLIPPL